MNFKKWIYSLVLLLFFTGYGHTTPNRSIKNALTGPPESKPKISDVLSGLNWQPVIENALYSGIVTGAIGYLTTSAKYTALVNRIKTKLSITDFKKSKAAIVDFFTKKSDDVANAGGSYLENLARYKQLFKEGKKAELFSELKKTTAFPKMGNTRVRNHTDLLAEYKAKYGQTATNYPYSPSNPVTDFELAETGYFVRVYDGDPNRVASKWVFRIEDLRQYKNADELMKKLALPTKPTRIAIVEVPENSGLRKSIAGSQEWSNGLKRSGGGVQYELNNFQRKWFKDVISIDEFFK